MKILTDEKYALIPQLITDGLNKEQIAAQFGCTVNTLQVKCSQRGISLRPNAVKKTRSRKIIIDPDVIKMYDDHAEAMGITAKEVIHKLLTVIAKDDLVVAVLDDA